MTNNTQYTARYEMARRSSKVIYLYLTLNLLGRSSQRLPSWGTGAQKPVKQQSHSPFLMTPHRRTPAAWGSAGARQCKWCTYISSDAARQIR